MATTMPLMRAFIKRGLAQLDPRVETNMRYVMQRGGAANTAIATADQAVAGTTLAASTYLGVTNAMGFGNDQAIVGGRYYSVDIYLATTVGASGGIKVALDGGTATATNVQLTYEHLTAAAIAVTDSAALATTAGAATTGVIAVRVKGTFQATASGSLVLRFSEFAAVSTATVKKGSYMSVTEIPTADNT